MASPAIQYTCGDAGIPPQRANSHAGMQGCKAQASLQAEARQRDARLPKWAWAWNLCGIGGCAPVTRLGMSRKQCATVAPRDF